MKDYRIILANGILFTKKADRLSISEGFFVLISGETIVAAIPSSCLVLES